MKRVARVFGVLSFVALAACDYAGRFQAPNIEFIDSAAPDFADVENRFPLDSQMLSTLMPEHLAGYTQGEIDQIYARLKAGALPDGVFDGAVFVPRHGGPSRDPGGVGIALWKRRVFDGRERLVRSVIGPEAVFPARLFCGQSLLDARRESIIVDYAFVDELPGYRTHLDDPPGRNGWQIRDEMRMVRPGFYLGRSYSGRTFLQNFVLYGIEQHAGETCWPGTQVHAVPSAPVRSR